MFTVSRLAARRVSKIRTFSDCQIDILHVIICEKYLNLCKIVIKIMDEKVKKVEEKYVVWLAVEITKRIRPIEYSTVFP